MRDVSFFLMWHKFQELPCGGGKELENDLRNLKSLVLCSRDALSLIILYVPLMWSTAIMLASHLWRRVANACSMFPASGDTLLLNFLVHATADTLSQKTAGL